MEKASSTPESGDLQEALELTLSTLTFPVVGIGCSAGGLQALLQFFGAVPADSGMAFMVILHLSPDHESSAAAILQRATAMPVTQVTGHTAIEANHVYVIPPGSDLVTNDGHIQPAPQAWPRMPAVAVDVFFRTLAQVHRERAIGIVLSGTGSDGSVGLVRVKEEGGITLAQAPDDAQHDGMPRAAIATGHVDLVLPATAMGQRLVDLGRNIQRIRLIAPGPRPQSPADGDANADADADVPFDARNSEKALQEILTLLRSFTRHDFRHYKRATMLRRITRRLHLHGLPDLASYSDFLRHHPKEAVPLLQDMLISVTNFFRDSEAFDALEREVIPQLFKNTGEQLRVWVPGCATGEESYSISMLLREQADMVANPRDVQIFATDIDERALAVGRRGLYAGAISADVSAARLRQFFVKDDDRFRIHGAVREQVLFAKHNLLLDPPFSRLDLICCRNLLIYLDRSAQATALEVFRYALKSGGFLFLGSSESPDVTGAAFTAVDKKNRIFRLDAHASTGAAVRTIAFDAASPAVVAPPHDEPGAREPRAAGVLHQRAVFRVAAPSVLIDGRHEVLHLSPGAGRYLEHGVGVPSHNILSLVLPEFRLELRAALFKAEQTGAVARTRVRQTHADGQSVAIDLAVHPQAGGGGESKEPQRWLVTFEESEEAPEATPSVAALADPQRAMFHRLEEENRQLKAHLQETLERSAVSNEELKASNEELQAINEELRSATEELETSKEELQSINEELSTVNYELRMKVEERGQINDDLQNLISSSEIATVFVDSSLRVKRFTPHASQLFNLIGSDVGRPLLDITNRLNYPELADDAATVFRDLHVIERKVTSNDARHYFARVLPYRTAGDKIEGAVLTFFDVTELDAARERLRIGEERLRLAAASTSDFAIITADDQGDITTWNAGAERIFGYREQELIGRSMAVIFTPEDRAAGVFEQELRDAREQGRAEDERWHRRKDGSTFFCSGVMISLKDNAAGGFTKIARDMTGSKRQELAQEILLLRAQQAKAEANAANVAKDRFLAVMSHELKQPLNLIQVNAELLTRLPETKGIASALRIGTTIQRAVGSQSKIINDLLDLSRIQTGKLRLNRTAVDLSELLHALAAAAIEDAKRKQLDLRVEEGEPLVCDCDRVRVEQIVWNLISNAIKFTPAGGKVTVRLGREDRFARLTVTDTGCGIRAQSLPHIFQMFNQARGEGGVGNGGFGIGLALVQELARAHRGRVDVASEGLGRGAKFTVWLPLQATGGQSEEAATAAVSLAGWQILLVDDDAESLGVFGALLQLEGAAVDTATSGNAALELLTKKDYDLLVSDIGMPQMDGHQLIAAVRTSTRTANLLAVAMSGFGRSVDVQRAIDAGFNAHVPKPASVDHLKRALAGQPLPSGVSSGG